MKEIEDGSVDMVLTDPPYGTTACKWDSVILFEPMWEQLKRVTKKSGAIVMTASQPFTSALVMSNPKAFRHEWIWKKDKSGNIAVLKYQPAKVHESVVVFGFESPFYYPQMEPRPQKNKRNNKPRFNKVGVQGGKEFFVEKSRGADDMKYPTSVKDFNVQRGGVHPTQKPVALMEYLIKTYANEGDTVLDFTMGSGTTGVAARRLNRHFIGIEMDEKYFKIAEERINSELL
jgi:site-specific DNA-methyltransferase (adenine-specific)